jgi:hypothetical protein
LGTSFAAVRYATLLSLAPPQGVPFPSLDDALGQVGCLNIPMRGFSMRFVAIFLMLVSTTLHAGVWQWITGETLDECVIRVQAQAPRDNAVGSAYLHECGDLIRREQAKQWREYVRQHPNWREEQRQAEEEQRQARLRAQREQEEQGRQVLSCTKGHPNYLPTFCPPN